MDYFLLLIAIFFLSVYVLNIKKYNPNCDPEQRPWGYYKVLLEGERYKIKEIYVNPGAALSYQMHNHRSEHWVVVSGLAKVTLEDRERFLQENESTYIPVRAKHRLENPGSIPLRIIEVQNGSYVGEDDIIRFEDNYGRVD